MGSFALCLSIVLCAASGSTCNSGDVGCIVSQGVSLLQVSYDIEKVTKEQVVATPRHKAQVLATLHHKAQTNTSSLPPPSTSATAGPQGNDSPPLPSPSAPVALVQTWFVCKQNRSQLRSPEEKAAGMDSVDEVKCTKQVNFGPQLCCARYEDKDFIHSGLMNLAGAQDSTSSSHESSVDPASFTDIISTKSRSASVVYKVCSQSSNGMALSHGHAASMPVECTNAEFTPEQLKGNPEDPNALQPGEIVLRERLLHFADQQIPLTGVPTCDKVASSCPDGKQPTVVKPAWLTKQMAIYQEVSIDGKSKQGTLLMQEESSLGMNGFNGALMTSGSFTMMASAID